MKESLELVDTSVWARRHHPWIRRWLTQAADAGELVLCPVIILELLRHVARRDYDSMSVNLSSFPLLDMTDTDWLEAQSIQAALARSSAQDHRKVKLPDLLIAAVAHRFDVMLVHYDEDYERIQAVTSQRMRWVASRGSLERN